MVRSRTKLCYYSDSKRKPFGTNQKDTHTLELCGGGVALRYIKSDFTPDMKKNKIYSELFSIRRLNQQFLDRGFRSLKFGQNTCIGVTTCGKVPFKALKPKRGGGTGYFLGHPKTGIGARLGGFEKVLTTKKKTRKKTRKKRFGFFRWIFFLKKS